MDDAPDPLVYGCGDYRTVPTATREEEATMMNSNSTELEEMKRDAFSWVLDLLHSAETRKKKLNFLQLISNIKSPF